MSCSHLNKNPNFQGFVVKIPRARQTPVRTVLDSQDVQEIAESMFFGAHQCGHGLQGDLL
jgi:hypothetical protein